MGSGRETSYRCCVRTAWLPSARTTGEIRWGDPMYTNYQWVAMLDPVELSHHVAVSDVRVAERFARPTWEVAGVGAGGLDPRCARRPLLRCEIADRYEYDRRLGHLDSTARPVVPRRRTTLHSTSRRRWSCGPRRSAATTPVLDFEVEILEVDADLRAVLD